MKILLVNSNQVVQKLIDVTTKKVDSDLITLNTFKEFEKEKELQKYDLIVFDHEVLEGYKGDFSFLIGLKSLLLYSQTFQDPAVLGHFTYMIKKPFLPNEFLNLIASIKQKLQEKQKEEFANLDEKEMFASIDAEAENDDDEDLKELLKGLNLTAEDEKPSQKSSDEKPNDTKLNDEILDDESKSEGDDLEALLQELPEEDSLEDESNIQEVLDGQEDLEAFEDKTELVDTQDSKQEQEEIHELDEMSEDDVQEIANQLQEITQEKNQEENKSEEEIEPQNEGVSENEDEHDELSKILNDTLESEEQEEDIPQVGGALDLAEIVKVQNLLHEVQKSGVKVEETTHKELDLLQSLLSSRSPEGIREILDGMQLTINISFPKKEN